MRRVKNGMGPTRGAPQACSACGQVGHKARAHGKVCTATQSVKDAYTEYKRREKEGIHQSVWPREGAIDLHARAGAEAARAGAAQDMQAQAQAAVQATPLADAHDTQGTVPIDDFMEEVNLSQTEYKLPRMVPRHAMREIKEKLRGLAQQVAAMAEAGNFQYDAAFIELCSIFATLGTQKQLRKEVLQAAVTANRVVVEEDQAEAEAVEDELEHANGEEEEPQPADMGNIDDNVNEQRIHGIAKDIHYLVSNHRLAAAWDSVRGSPLAPYSRETLAKLQALHPPSHPIAPLTEEDVVAIPYMSFGSEVLIRVIQSLKPYKAPGCSGMTYEHLKFIIAGEYAEEGVQLLSNFVQAIISGKWASKELLRCRLIPFLKYKDDGTISEKVRPIAIGETLLRVAQKTALKMLAKKIKPCWEGYQMGVGMKNGRDKIVLLCKGEEVKSIYMEDRLHQCL